MSCPRNEIWISCTIWNANMILEHRITTGNGVNFGAAGMIEDRVGGIFGVIV